LKQYKDIEELKQYKSIPEDVLWNSIKSIQGFWEDLEPFEGYKEFVATCMEYGEVHILSGYSKHDYDRSIAGKLVWLAKYLPEIPLKNVHLVDRKSKKDYAYQDTILIDDYEKNIKDFKNNGGRSILHKSFKDSLYELVNIIDN
jgi:5'(3')-deoxyribonucleotidase